MVCLIVWFWSYRPLGPQTNVPLSVVTRGGWKVCFATTYADALPNSTVQDIHDNNCTKQNIMLACGRSNDSDVPETLQLLAWAPRDDVFGMTDDVGNVTQGTRFYRTGDDGVMGFTGGHQENRGETGGRCSDQNEGGQHMLCWFTSGKYAGGRCGKDMGLSTSEWKQIFLQSY